MNRPKEPDFPVEIGAGNTVEMLDVLMWLSYLKELEIYTNHLEHTIVKLKSREILK